MTETRSEPRHVLHGLGELVAYVPYLLGFHPRESVVVLGGGPDGYGPSARYDIVAPPDQRAELLRQVTQMMQRAGVAWHDVVVFSAAPDVATVADEAAEALRAANPVNHVVLVRPAEGDRPAQWCIDDCRCGGRCPREVWQPVPAADRIPAVADHVLGERTPAAEREDLVRSLRPAPLRPRAVAQWVQTRVLGPDEEDELDDLDDRFADWAEATADDDLCDDWDDAWAAEWGEPDDDRDDPDLDPDHVGPAGGEALLDALERSAQAARRLACPNPYVWGDYPAALARVLDPSPDAPRVRDLPVGDLGTVLMTLRERNLRDHLMGWLAMTPMTVPGLFPDLTRAIRRAGAVPFDDRVLTSAEVTRVTERLRELVRSAPEPVVPAPATLLAYWCWTHGGGALALVALDRALEADPDYRMAGLLMQVVTHGMRPLDLCPTTREAAV